MDIEIIIPDRIYSIIYDDQDINEYYRLFNREWNDIDFLLNFFRSHKEYTDNDFWSYLNNDPEEATARVIKDANHLESHIIELAKNSDKGEKPDLDEYFEPLDGEFVYEFTNTPMKGYGMTNPSFIRLYAIKIASNCYLIVYGGIKLKDKIENSPVLQDYVIKKIKQVRKFLKECALDKDDL